MPRLPTSVRGGPTQRPCGEVHGRASARLPLTPGPGGSLKVLTQNQKERGLWNWEARRTQRPEEAGPVGPWTPRGRCGRISRQAEDTGDDGVSVLRVWVGSWAEAGLRLSDMQLPAAHVHPGNMTSQNRTAK